MAVLVGRVARGHQHRLEGVAVKVDIPACRVVDAGVVDQRRHNPVPVLASGYGENLTE